MIQPSLIHQIFLSTYYNLGTMLGTRYTMNKKTIVFHLHGTCLLLWKIDKNKHIKNKNYKHENAIKETNKALKHISL